jgi:hypothetical protein
MFVFSVLVLNRADNKNSVMTLTRIQNKMYLIFSNFRISKDIVLASGFNCRGRHVSEPQMVVLMPIHWTLSLQSCLAQ